MFALSLSILRAPQPYGLEACKAFKALSLAFLVLLCFERNGTKRDFDRIPPPSGIFSVFPPYFELPPSVASTASI